MDLQISNRPKRIRWTGEMLASLRLRVEALAAELTRTRGVATISGITEALLPGSRNREPVAAVMHELETEGRVRRHGRIGWRTVNVIPAAVRIPKRPSRWSATALGQVRNRLANWTRAATEAHGHFTRAAAMRALEPSSDVVKPMLTEMVRSGALVRLPGVLGYRAVGVDGPAPIAPSRKLRWTEEALRDLRDRLIDYARSETLERGRYTLSAATRVLTETTNGHPVKYVNDELAAEGLVELVSNRVGYRWRGVQPGGVDLAGCGKTGCHERPLLLP